MKKGKKYRIERTSDFCGSEERLCENAYAEGCDEWGTPIWYIEINTLEELQELIEEVKHPVIISKGHIEIYDEYRE